MNLIAKLESAKSTSSYSDFDDEEEKLSQSEKDKIEEAISVLGNRSILFNQNEIFEESENHPDQVNVGSTGIIQSEKGSLPT